ncbi:MAG: DNA repair protein RadA [Legionellales bacterium]|nr:DNA repair protein RadA [Legionellales bacterium]
MKTVFICSSCGAQEPKWQGQCPNCQSWNTLVENVQQKQDKRSMTILGKNCKPVKLSQVSVNAVERYLTKNPELDRVLGGGIVPGSVILIGGDPGIGKSTLLSRTLVDITQQKLQGLYVSGEESLEQISLRMKQLGLASEQVWLLAQTQLEQILEQVKETLPSILVIDSIQTLWSADLSSAAGSVSQVRECAMRLVSLAKELNVALFLVGHVTKEGTLAGPRVLEHMVDVVLYFEGEQSGRFRMIRAVKNRYGASNELGVFAMTEQGIRPVSNPSAIFLSGCRQSSPGSCVLVTWEGTRPLLVEVQVLIDSSVANYPRRVAVGLDPQRLVLLLAALSRHGGCQLHNYDVYVNVVGGLKISETAIDLALLVALLSSLRHKSIPTDWVVFGEIGLNGEVRPVQNGLLRLKEAQKHGFKHAIIPKANDSQANKTPMTLHRITYMKEAIRVIDSALTSTAASVTEE